MNKRTTPYRSLGIYLDQDRDPCHRQCRNLPEEERLVRLLRRL